MESARCCHIKCTTWYSLWLFSFIKVDENTVHSFHLLGPKILRSVLPSSMIWLWKFLTPLLAVLVSISVLPQLGVKPGTSVGTALGICCVVAIVPWLRSFWGQNKRNPPMFPWLAIRPPISVLSYYDFCKFKKWEFDRFGDQSEFFFTFTPNH